MKYRLRHTTSYSYSWAVDISHHLLHLSLPELPRQRVKSCIVTTNPNAGRIAAQIDHFGNRVANLTIDAPHTRFDVELRAEVEVDPWQPPDAKATPAWEDIREALCGDGFPEPVRESEFVHDPYNEAYFEHIYLARELGATLVEGADLTMRDGRIFIKTLAGLEPVDVILRRLDGEWCDPLELRLARTDRAHHGIV